MKKCPFCKADIEDNARFCLYCMSSLQEKQKIENQQKDNKRWLYILAAFLLLVFAFAITIFALSKNGANNNSSENSMYSETLPLNNSSYTSDILSSNNTSDDVSKNTSTDNSSQDKTPHNSSSDKTNPDDNSDTTTTTSHSQSSTISSSSSDTTTSTVSPSQPSESDNTQTSEEQNSSQETIMPVEAVYIYRDAVAADCYTAGNIPAQPIEDVIVITGVSCAASDGIYNIPEEIDGKRVGAIMPSAFSDTAISSTVKKVVVPSTVKTIWQNAFSNCYNLTDIYLCGATINIFESAFADVSNRTGTLTIHCARDCKTFAFYYYRNIVGNYDALYQEWNGGEIE